MKRAAVVTLCLTLGVFAGTSLATGVTVFGPNQYVRTKGKPNVYTDTFASTSEEGVLKVKNGDQNGGHRLSSAKVFINGEQIFGSSNFNQQVCLLESPVSLTETNSIEVDLRSKPGGYLTIEITQEVDPPTVSLSADLETILLGDSATLTWSSTTADTCVIEPGIGAVDVNGSMQVSPDVTTTYTITATGPGGSSTDSVTVSVNAQPPFSEIEITADDLAAGDNFGQSVSLSGDYFIVGTPNDDDGGYYSGSAYIFKREGSTWTQQAKLTAGDAAAYDYFGSSVSISGDTVIVGAYGDDDGGESSGSAYIFKREGSTWTQQAKLTAGDAAAYDYFGSSVSISGDYAIVGAYGNDHAGESSGAAYIFIIASSVTQLDKLTADDAEAYDYFGWSVSISGDYAVVGAYGDDEGGESSGSAYIFNDEGEQTKITADDAEAYDYFGWSVSINGNHAIVGAYGDDDVGIDSGAAYIFSTASPWTQRTKITDSDAGAYAHLGYTVVIASLTGQFPQIPNSFYAAVGAPGYIKRGNPTKAGMMFMYRGYDMIWTLQFSLTASDAEPDDQFGMSVGISNGITIIGTPQSDNAGQDSGSAYIFSFCTVDMNTEPEIIMIGESSTLSWNSNYADSLSIDQGVGTVSSSGSLTVSPQQTTTYTITASGPGGTSSDKVTVNVIDPSAPPVVEILASSDSIYVGRSPTLTWSSTNADSCVIEPGIGSVDLSGSLAISPAVTTAYTITATGPAGTTTATVTVTVNPRPSNECKLTANDAAAYDYFGSSVSISGDTVIVGAYGDDDGGESSGAAYIFKREGSTWTQQAKLNAGDAAFYDRFGMYVSISGDTAIVGVPYDDDAGSFSGSAYIFTREGAIWTQQAKLTANDAAAGDYFGWSVSLDGDSAIVGAHRDDDAGSFSGSAYIFKREGTTWIQQAKLTAIDAAPIVSFGYSVSISGDTAIVSAPRDESVGRESGAAYIFKRDGAIWTQQIKLTASDAAAYDYCKFGFSVSISGDYAFVGADSFDNDNNNLGSVYLFKREGTTWTELSKLTASDATIGDRFGESVSISGAYAIVSAYADDDSGENSGAAYIFKREGTTMTQMAKLTADDAAAGDYFGESLSISGDTAIVGARYDDDGGNNSGSAYVYNLSITTVNMVTDPEIIQVGESATLTWSAENADSISIDQSIGTVSAEGSLTVSPQETTTYTITANGSAGTSTDKVTVHVIDPSVPPTVSISATPDIITLGETFVLNWNSTNADSCVIEPGIGSVDLSGPMKISLGETMTYTITAAGPAGTSSESVTVIVNSPTVPPTIDISANPETIIFGQSASLAWNSTNTYSCTIEPDIGRVDLNGSINVSPAATTTYTITATGYAGTTTGSATVTVFPLPTVNFSANPLSIDAGESATLTWDSANADSCVIEPGIGSVDLSGSLQVSPTETTIYTITARGPGGKASESVTIDVTPPVRIQITSPVHMQNIARPDIMVEGTISDSLGIDTGVTVNGRAATIFNDHFVANHVPLQDGENTITVVGTDSQGYTATAEITVYANTSGNYITVTADTESGVSPFETTLQVEGTFSFLQEPIITPAGPDDVDPFENLGDAQYRVGMTTPGIYYFTAEATDDQSNTYTDTIAVVVLDQVQRDALLKAKWNGMKTALINRNFDGALAYFANGTKDNYQQIFSLLTEDKLQGIASGMREIEKIHIEENRAKYGINREKIVQGVLHDITYIIYFVKDGDGLWKIESF